MLLGIKHPRLVELLLGLEDAVVDHLQRAAGAFTGAEVFEDKFFLRFPVIIVAGVRVERRQNAVRDQFFFQRGLPYAVDEIAKAFALPAVPPPHRQQMGKRVRHILRRELDGHLPDLRHAVDPPAEMQLIMRCDMISQALADTVQADRRDVMLGTRIVTAADLDRHVAQILRDVPGRKDFRQRSGHAFRRRNP